MRVLLDPVERFREAFPQNQQTDNVLQGQKVRAPRDFQLRGFRRAFPELNLRKRLRGIRRLRLRHGHRLFPRVLFAQYRKRPFVKRKNPENFPRLSDNDDLYRNFIARI